MFLWGKLNKTKKKDANVCQVSWSFWSNQHMSHICCSGQSVAHQTDNEKLNPVILDSLQHQSWSIPSPRIQLFAPTITRSIKPMSSCSWVENNLFVKHFKRLQLLRFNREKTVFFYKSSTTKTQKQKKPKTKQVNPDKCTVACHCRRSVHRHRGSQGFQCAKPEVSRVSMSTGMLQKKSENREQSRFSEGWCQQAVLIWIRNVLNCCKTHFLGCKENLFIVSLFKNTGILIVNPEISFIKILNQIWRGRDRV